MNYAFFFPPPRCSPLYADDTLVCPLNLPRAAALPRLGLPIKIKQLPHPPVGAPVRLPQEGASVCVSSSVCFGLQTGRPSSPWQTIPGIPYKLFICTSSPCALLPPSRQETDTARLQKTLSPLPPSTQPGEETDAHPFPKWPPGVKRRRRHWDRFSFRTRTNAT